MTLCIFFINVLHYPTLFFFSFFIFTNFAQSNWDQSCTRTQQCKDRTIRGTRVECSANQACETAHITILENGVLVCDANEACKTATITIADGGHLECSGPGACIDAVIACEGYCIVECVRYEACKASSMDCLGDCCTKICSGEKACEDVTARNCWSSTTSTTRNPSPSPTFLPTPPPTHHPTLYPSHHPSLSPSRQPTLSPTRNPTLLPTHLPTRTPSKIPTLTPSLCPTGTPTRAPSYDPSSSPTDFPSLPPTHQPTSLPSHHPTLNLLPSPQPTLPPMRTPSNIPTFTPLLFPTGSPSFFTTSYTPTLNPSNEPTHNPSDEPNVLEGNDLLAHCAPCIEDLMSANGSGCDCLLSDTCNTATAISCENCISTMIEFCSSLLPYQILGHGYCKDENGQDLDVYFGHGKDARWCDIYCSLYDECLGYAHALESGYCGLYVADGVTLPTPDGLMYYPMYSGSGVEQASGTGYADLVCYKKPITQINWESISTGSCAENTILTEYQCHIVSEELGLDTPQIEIVSNWPPGCYQYQGGDFWYNRNWDSQIPCDGHPCVCLAGGSTNPPMTVTPEFDFHRNGWCATANETFPPNFGTIYNVPTLQECYQHCFDDIECEMFGYATGSNIALRCRLYPGPQSIYTNSYNYPTAKCYKMERHSTTSVDTTTTVQSIPRCSNEVFNRIWFILSAECRIELVSVDVDDLQLLTFDECQCILSTTSEIFEIQTGVSPDSCGSGSGMSYSQERDLCISLYGSDRWDDLNCYADDTYTTIVNSHCIDTDPTMVETGSRHYNYMYIVEHCEGSECGNDFGCDNSGQTFPLPWNHEDIGVLSLPCSRKPKQVPESTTSAPMNNDLSAESISRISLEATVSGVDDLNAVDVCLSVADALGGFSTYCKLSGASSRIQVVGRRKLLDTSTLYMDIVVGDAAAAMTQIESESFVESLQNLPHVVNITSITFAKNSLQCEDWCGSTSECSGKDFAFHVTTNGLCQCEDCGNTNPSCICENGSITGSNDWERNCNCVSSNDALSIGDYIYSSEQFGERHPACVIDLIGTQHLGISYLYGMRPYQLISTEEDFILIESNSRQCDGLIEVSPTVSTLNSNMFVFSTDGRCPDNYRVVDSMRECVLGLMLRGETIKPLNYDEQYMDSDLRCYSAYNESGIEEWVWVGHEEEQEIERLLCSNHFANNYTVETQPTESYIRGNHTLFIDFVSWKNAHILCEQRGLQSATNQQIADMQELALYASTEYIWTGQHTDESNGHYCFHSNNMQFEECDRNSLFNFMCQNRTNVSTSLPASQLRGSDVGLCDQGALLQCSQTWTNATCRSDCSQIRTVEEACLETGFWSLPEYSSDDQAFDICHTTCFSECSDCSTNECHDCGSCAEYESHGQYLGCRLSNNAEECLAFSADGVWCGMFAAFVKYTSCDSHEDCLYTRDQESGEIFQSYCFDVAYRFDDRYGSTLFSCAENPEDCCECRSADPFDRETNNCPEYIDCASICAVPSVDPSTNILLIAIKGTTTDALQTTAEPMLESGGKAESDAITDSMDHWTGKVLIYQAAILIIMWIIMVLIISNQKSLHWTEKREDIRVWAKGALGTFDFFSDIALLIYMEDNGFHSYYVIYSIILFLAAIKSVSLLIHRARDLLNEPLVLHWRHRTYGGFVILPILFIISGLSPRYYDLLLTSQIDFPIRPTDRKFIIKEKLFHLVVENVSSLAVTVAFLSHQEGNMIAYISLVMSIIMTYIQLISGSCFAYFEHTSGSFSDIRVILKRHQGAKTPHRRTIKKHIKEVLDATCAVDVWYLARHKKTYEVYIWITTYSNDLVLDKDDIKQTVHKCFDKQGLSLRKSIQIRSPNVTPSQLSSSGDSVELVKSDFAMHAHKSNEEESEHANYVALETISHNDEYIHSPFLDMMWPGGSRMSIFGASSFHLDDLNFQAEYIGTEDVPMTPNPTTVEQTSGGCNLPVGYEDLLKDSFVELDLNQLLGSGQFGKVYIGLYQGIPCAFKEILDINDFKCENYLFKDVSRHPSICTWYGLCKPTQLSGNYFICMEYYQDGSLLEVIQAHAFTSEEKVNFCLQLGTGLWHLHGKDVLHCDLALRNVLIDLKHKKVVLSDFGQSRRFPCMEEQKMIAARWASRDLMKTRLPTHEADVWALAVTFWEIWADGVQPYAHLKIQQVVERLTYGNLSPRCESEWEITPLLNEIFENVHQFTAERLYRRLRDIGGNLVALTLVKTSSAKAL